MQQDRARYYHPGPQRFISEDPIGLLSGDTNYYVYVANDPVGFVDPLGLDKQPACRGAAYGEEAAIRSADRVVGTTLARTRPVLRSSSPAMMALEM